jgi:predicted DCC family thiol-disulfide oxidoreductase YuxK
VKIAKKLASKHIIFFDDKCSFCWRSVNRVLAWDKRGIFHFSPIQDPLAKSVLKQEWNPLKKAGTLILIEKGAKGKQRIWVKGRAVMRIFWLLGGWKKIVGMLCFIPIGLDPIYSFIAKRRHRF